MKFCLKPGYTASSAGQVPKLPLKIYLCATHKFNCVFQVLRRRCCCCCCCPCSFRSTINSLFKHCSLSLRWRGEMAKSNGKLSTRACVEMKKWNFHCLPRPKCLKKCRILIAFFLTLNRVRAFLVTLRWLGIPQIPRLAARASLDRYPFEVLTPGDQASGSWLLAAGSWLLLLRQLLVSSHTSHCSRMPLSAVPNATPAVTGCANAWPSHL